MYRKINVFVNGAYEFSTNAYESCTELIKEIRARKHLGIVNGRYLTVYDYDTLRAKYAA